MTNFYMLESNTGVPTVLSAGRRLETVPVTLISRHLSVMKFSNISRKTKIIAIPATEGKISLT